MPNEHKLGILKKHHSVKLGFGYWTKRHEKRHIILLMTCHTRCVRCWVSPMIRPPGTAQSSFKWEKKLQLPNTSFIWICSCLTPTLKTFISASLANPCLREHVQNRTDHRWHALSYNKSMPLLKQTPAFLETKCCHHLMCIITEFRINSWCSRTHWAGQRRGSGGCLRR